MTTAHVRAAAQSPAHPADALERRAPEDAAPQDRPRRPRLLELGVGLIVVVLPLVFLPMSASPFADVKVVALLSGCLLIWASGVKADRQLALLAWLFVGVMAAAAIVGVDRWVSVFGPDGVASGLILFGPSVYLLAVGPSLPTDLVDRAPLWLFVTAVPVSALAIVWRFAPDLISGVVPDLAFDGSTLGHPVFLAGMAAAGRSAVVAVRIRHRPWLVLGLVVLATGLSLSSKRAGLVALAAGLLVGLLRARAGRTRWIVVSVVVATLLGWAVAAPFVEDGEPISGVGRFQELTTDSARARVVMTGVFARSWLERPALGWGPGNSWSAYLRTASEREVERATRGVGDTHNIVVGSAVTTGILGLIVLLWIIAVVLRRAAAADRRFGWAAAVASSLFVFHLLQPVNVALTPLLFLTAGMALGHSDAAPRRPAPLRRTAVGILLAIGLIASLVVLTSSVLEQWGRTYNSTWALRWAVTLAPGRISPLPTLAVYLAQDASGGDAAKVDEVRDLVETAVERHRWNPGVRWVGVDAGLSMHDYEYARGWLRQQVELFPGDLASFSPQALEFLTTGEPPSPSSYLQSLPAGAETSDE